MPAATSELALPYPTLSDAPNIPAAFQALADRIEALGLPLGEVGYAQATADQALSAGTEADLTGLTATVTVLANRRIRITGDVMVTSTVATDHVVLYIKEGATYLMQRQTPIARANSGHVLQASVVLNPTAGAHTYKLAMIRGAGSGTVSSQAAGVFPAHITVKDIGPA